MNVSAEVLGPSHSYCRSSLNQMKIKFVGAAGGSVTGSCTHFHYPRTKTSFLVDCGMVQGEGDVESINAAPFPFDAREIQFVLLTHAHLDHCGLLPKLYREGFTGEVICTAATAELAKLSLMDSAGYPKSLYNRDEVRKLRFKAIEDQPGMATAAMFPVRKDLFVGFRRTAHVIGACSVTIGWMGADDTRHFILMSGDLGNNTKGNLYQPLLGHRQSIFAYPDAIVVEATYGNRTRPPEYKSFDARIEALRDLLLSEVFGRKALLVVPAFALQRTQEFLLDLVVVLTRFFSSAETATAPFLPAATLGVHFSDERWNWTAHDAVRRALASLPLEEQAAWQSAFTDTGDEHFPHRLADGSPKTIQDLQNLLTSQREPYPIDVVLDSKLARAMGAVVRDELMRKSAHKPSELAHRNPLLMDRLGCVSEAELEALLHRLLPDPGLEPQPLQIGPHTVRHCESAVVPRVAESMRRGTILITGGGMCDGGPVIKHLEKVATQRRECVLVQTGYMAKYSLGNRLFNLARGNEAGQDKPPGTITIGALTDIPHEDLHLRAVDLSGFYSGHADQVDLLDFVFSTDGRTTSGQEPPPATVFINHGNPDGRQALKAAMQQRQGQGLPSDRAIQAVELPELHQPAFDLEARRWESSTEDLTSEETLKALLREQMTTNDLLRQVLQVLSQSAPAAGPGSAREPSKTKPPHAR